MYVDPTAVTGVAVSVPVCEVPELDGARTERQADSKRARCLWQQLEYYDEHITRIRSLRLATLNPEAHSHGNSDQVRLRMSAGDTISSMSVVTRIRRRRGSTTPSRSTVTSMLVRSFLVMQNL